MRKASIMLAFMLVSLSVYNCLIQIKLSETRKALVEESRKEPAESVKEIIKEIEVYPNTYELAEEIYGVDRYLLESIERLETGNFSSELYLNKNNTFGANDGHVYFRYDSPIQSTMELARTLRFSYIDAGLDTIEEINSVFCPNNPEWGKRIIKIYSELLMDEGR